jgi:hypothetical protein
MILAGHVAIGVTSRSSHAPACTEQVPDWAGGIGWATCGSQRAGMGLQICSRHVARWVRHSAENLARLVGLLGVFLAYQAFERQARRQKSRPFNVNLFDSCNGERHGRSLHYGKEVGRVGYAGWCMQGLPNQWQRDRRLRAYTCSKFSTFLCPTPFEIGSSARHLPGLLIPRLDSSWKAPPGGRWACPCSAPSHEVASGSGGGFRRFSGFLEGIPWACI